MNSFRIPQMGRKIISMEVEPDSVPVVASPVIEEPRQEKSRILGRLLAIIGDHSISAERVGIKLSPEELRLVFEALRNHAISGTEPDFPNLSEIQRYVLGSLFSELVEEPSNILYATQISPDTIRYDAMEANFWIECLDLLEKTLCQ
ncbi:hypothetical protein ACFSSA_00855 [Luteolibacter algae]|uniref:Uncharacterized protein n=1 Tax=Luteolibacter algae TaxID=454151 RepID=A0ABW5D5C5_9BACT